MLQIADNFSLQNRMHFFMLLRPKNDCDRASVAVCENINTIFCEKRPKGAFLQQLIDYLCNRINCARVQYKFALKFGENDVLKGCKKHQVHHGVRVCFV